MTYRTPWILGAVLFLLPVGANAAPQDVGMDVDILSRIDDVVAEGVRASEMPGAVVLIGRHDKIIFRKAYGNRQEKPEPMAMEVDTVFDLASLTKPLATATSIMHLAERGKIELHAPVARYWPEFARNGKEDVTLLHLLTHQSGLTPDNSLADYQDGPDEAWRRIAELGLRSKPGERFAYSDVGFLVLAKVVERVSGMDVDAYSRRHVFEPLGMHETGYLPSEPLRERAAPTEQRDGEWMRGEVHDPRAFALGGVAGHAGLFSTADDLAVYARMMLGDGQLNGIRVLSADSVRRMTSPYPVSSGLRGLGWDIRTGYSLNRGDGFSARAFGHGGFTGTALWIDPELDLFVIFLSNRLHPDGRGSVNRIAGRIGSIAAEAIVEDRPPVLTGFDVARRDGFPQLRGRVGLITNQTGVGRDGNSIIRLLHESPKVDLAALFSPEHGLEGKLDIPRIADGRDDASGLPIHSLYGETRKPTAEMLDGVDTLVFDIQDIGSRFYTYISTMGLAMEAAAEHDVRFVVLDRPNPLGGVVVDGPMLDAGAESFVGYHSLPVQHGMTVGELARMFQAERELDVELIVVPVENWRRDDFFDATGLPWINPSPNMRSLAEAVLYPGVGLIEMTNVSVGRGTDTPFEVVGAPWIDGRRLAAALNARRMPGVRFVPIRFTPDASKYEGELCGGVNIVVTDREAFRSVSTGLEIARQMRRLYPDRWSGDAYGRLLGNAATLEGILEGDSLTDIEAACRPDLEAFRERRAQYLMYGTR